MGKSMSESSLDSVKIRGEDEIDNYSNSISSPSKIKFEKEVDESDDDEKTPGTSTKMSEVSKKNR